jgi:hypothetical protein
MGVTKLQNPFKTVDDWAVPTPRPTSTLTGYDCYYSSLCSGTAAATIIPVPSSNTGVETTASAVKDLLVKILVPVCLFAVALSLFIFYRRSRRERNLPRQQNRQDDGQMVNLLHFIINTLDQQQQQAPPNNAMVHQVQRMNNSMIELRATVANILVRLDQQPLVQGPGQHHPPGDHLRDALREQLSCPICFEIFYHPVAVINDATYQGGGCCKVVIQTPKCLLTRI